jgi:hypothetical protein
VMAGCFVSGGALFFPYAAPRKYQTLGHNLPRGSGVGINYVAPWWGGRDRVALMPHALMISQAHAIPERNRHALFRFSSLDFQVWSVDINFCRSSSCSRVRYSSSS